MEDSASEQNLATANLSKRAINALMRGGIHTLEDAAEWSDRDLLSLPHFGPASVATLRKLITVQRERGQVLQKDP